ncbi:phosphoribosyltransferase family protein [Streptomyces mashuensis]|uniref:phosphoribosyltransferase family protein n=1 Tax=Streptomyces mashuensis TaxID=33904 RepID=UPI00167E18A1|nr:phosphoribosyltransferase family protein [Streptomyces mashuensis]
MLQATGQVYLDGEQPSVNPIPRGARLLVVDDIAGSGATLRTVQTWLRARLQPAALRSAVLCRNRGTGTTPDTWGWDVADWVRFLWEGPLDQATEPLPTLTVLHHRRDWPPTPPSLTSALAPAPTRSLPRTDKRRQAMTFGLVPGNRVLIVPPHPDDETLGAGGTIARLTAEGVEVHVLAVTCYPLPPLGKGGQHRTAP